MGAGDTKKKIKYVHLQVAISFICMCDCFCFTINDSHCFRDECQLEQVHERDQVGEYEWSHDKNKLLLLS